MARPTRTITCPRCDEQRTTRAYGGIPIKCHGCGSYFKCPAKPAGNAAHGDAGERDGPAGDDAPPSSSPAGRRAGSDGVRVRRASKVTAGRPEPEPEPQPEPAPEPAPEPDEPDPEPSQPRRPRGARSHLLRRKRQKASS